MPGKDTASNAVNAVTFNAQLARKVAQARHSDTASMKCLLSWRSV